MINKVIFIVSAPLYIGDYERYGAEILIDNGFNIQFLDITPYIYPVLFSNATKKNLYKGVNKKTLHDKASALKEINLITSDSIILLLLHFNYNTYHIFRAISKASLEYAVPILSTVPKFAYNTSKKYFFSKTPFC